MRGLLFFVLWMLFAVGLPLAIAAIFPFGGPLVSLGAMVGFIGGGILAGWLVGFFKPP